MDTIKQTLFTGWNAMRWIRFVLGMFIAYQAIQLHDTMSGLIAGLLLFQSLTNTGCCGTQGCTVPRDKMSSNTTEKVEFEEIKK